MQHLNIPAGSGLDRVETLPREEAQGGREQPGGGSQGDAGAALAQDVRHEGAPRNRCGS